MRCFLRMTLFALGGLALQAALRAEDFPPVSDPATGRWTQGKYVWADLFTADPGDASQFYCDLFGWTPSMLSRGNRTYIVLSNQGRPVAGIVLRPRWLKDEVRGRWVGYLSVADVARTARRATANSGRLLFGPKDLGNRGTQAVLVDDQDVLIGLLHSSTGDPEDYEAEPGEWVWAQTFVREPAKAAAYYQEVFGYEATPDTRTARSDAYILSSGGYARGGLGPVPFRPDARPGWLGFVRVGDLGAALARARQLGGRVLVSPKTRPDSRLAVIADPLGAAVGLIQLVDQPAAGPRP